MNNSEKNEHEEYLQDVTDYVLKRAIAEGSIVAYYEQHFNKEMSLREFIYKILYLHDEIQDYDGTGNDFLCDDEEYAYISEKIGIPSMKVIELVIWFCNCEMMGDGRVTWVADCPECGHDELYQREAEGGSVFESYLECVNCGRKYPFDILFDEPDDELLPKKNTEPDPSE